MLRSIRPAAGTSPTFNDQAIFEFGAFSPPTPEGSDTCYISDHTDIAMGINGASANQEDAKVFLEWAASEEFATLYANALPGFFSLSNFSVQLEDPVAQEFVSWREKCQSTIRNSYQILSRGTPNLENELWNVSAQVLNGTLSPEEAADQGPVRSRQVVRAAAVDEPRCGRQCAVRTGSPEQSRT